MCNEPVVENGDKISGFESLYTFNTSISFECKIGYFMIGSYMAQCDEHGTWKPGLPTCKKSKNLLKKKTNPIQLPLCFLIASKPLKHNFITRFAKGRYSPSFSL